MRYLVLVLVLLCLVGCSRNISPQQIEATLAPIQAFAENMGAAGEVKLRWRADARFGMVEQFVIESPGTEVLLDLRVDPQNAKVLNKAISNE